MSEKEQGDASSRDETIVDGDGEKREGHPSNLNLVSYKVFTLNINVNTLNIEIQRSIDVFVKYNVV
jgi:hypothetical protein